MRPTLEPGDRLLVDPVDRGGPEPKEGDVVVLRDPEQAGRLLVKRVAATPTRPTGPDPAGWIRPVFVVGDRPEVSRDSRTFGPVPARDIVGVAWFRYLPRERRGPLAPGTEVLRAKP